MKPLKFKEFVSEKKEIKGKEKEVAKVVEPEEIKKKGKPVKAEVVEPEPEKKKGLTPRQQKYLPEPLKAAILKAQGESIHVQKFVDFINENKKTMTKKELKNRVKEEAQRMFSDIKKQGGGMSLSDCKKEAEKTFRDEYNIIDESVDTQFSQSTIDAICDEAKYGNRVLINGKTAWSGLGDRTSLYSFANELTQQKWDKSGEKLKKKLQSLNKFQDVVEIQSYTNTGRFKGKWETVRRFKAK